MSDISLLYSTDNTTVVTDSDGNFTFSNLTGEGLVQPSSEEYTVLPTKISVDSNSGNLEFKASNTINDARTMINNLPDGTYESSESTTVGGTITHIMEFSSATSIYIEEKQFDAPGIVIRVEATEPNYSIGDQIIVKGLPGTYYNMAQFNVAAFDDIKVIAENTDVPEPKTVISTDLSADNGEPYEGRLVKIENVTVDNINQYGDVTVSDSSGQAIVELQDNQSDWLSAGDEYDYIIGVVDYNYDEYKIRPRSTSDISKKEDDSTTTYTAYSIYEIQGESHESPLLEENAEASGIVTAIDSTGFYIQNTEPDNVDATSEGLYVLGSGEVSVGDDVTVKGQVIEYQIPYGDDAFWINTERQLTKTTIDLSEVTVNSSGNTLPIPISLGSDRSVPQLSIDDDSFGSFDVSEDAIDFYESLEGMRVSIEEAIAVGPTKYGQTPVLPNNGTGSPNKTIYDGLYISEGDYNPERIIFESDTIEQIDTVGDGYADSYDLGTEFNETLVGVVGYDEGNYMVYNTKEYGSNLVSQPSNSRETTSLDSADALQVATYNIENFSAESSSSRTAGLASSIVDNLGSPDIIGLQEVQDNNGETDDGTVAADQTYQKLIDAIVAAGGPSYEYLNIDPENNADGGAPGGNIRVGILYDPSTINFTAKGSPDATTAVSVEGSGTTTTLSMNPGRVEPAAFSGSRKPLAAELEYNGEKLFIVVNHLSSKGGDDPLFGNRQPPVLESEVERLEQAEAVNNFVTKILDANANANVIVLGDMNDFEFSDPVETLAGNELNNLMYNIPESERFTYNFGGNSQVLDHILVSDNLYSLGGGVEAVTVNSIFAEYDPGTGIYTDHDPVIAETIFPQK